MSWGRREDMQQIMTFFSDDQHLHREQGRQLFFFYNFISLQFPKAHKNNDEEISNPVTMDLVYFSSKGASGPLYFTKEKSKNSKKA